MTRGQTTENILCICKVTLQIVHNSNNAIPWMFRLSALLSHGKIKSGPMA